MCRHRKRGVAVTTHGTADGWQALCGEERKNRLSNMRSEAFEAQVKGARLRERAAELFVAADALESIAAAGDGAACPCLPCSIARRR
jgi:hypothetical protein